MAFDKDAFLAAMDSMSVMELNDLVKACLLYTSPSPRD